jgi:hypothetical protein
MSAWMHIYLVLAQLKSLERLRVWVDHDDISSWTLVNERAILHPLEPLLEHSNLDMSICLPKLHPRWENPYRHFIQDNPIFTIHRRRRHIYHSSEDDQGIFSVIEQSDFPILGDFWDVIVDFINDLTWDEPPMGYYSAAQMENAERDMWAHGRDVVRFTYDFHDNALFEHYSSEKEWNHEGHLNISWGETRIVDDRVVVVNPIQ